MEFVNGISWQKQVALAITARYFSSLNIAVHAREALTRRAQIAVTMGNVKSRSNLKKSKPSSPAVCFPGDGDAGRT